MPRRVLVNILALTLLAALAAPQPSDAAGKPPLPQTGAIWEGPAGSHLLLVRPANPKSMPPTPQRPINNIPAFTLVEQFAVPDYVTLKPGLFPTRERLERYLLTQYITPLIPDDAGDVIPPDCPPPGIPGGVATDQIAPTNGQSGGGQFSGPPRIFIVLPTSGPAFLPIAIGGSNFATCAIPHINNTPSIALHAFSLQNLPLIGSISVGFTIVPPAAPSGPGDVIIEYLGQRSNPFPFTVQ